MGLGRMGQRENASYGDDGVDVSVGVSVGVVVVIGVNSQVVSLGQSEKSIAIDMLHTTPFNCCVRP